MSRQLTAAATTAATAEVVCRTVAVELLFDSGAVRLNGGLVPITIGGQEFGAVGALGSISPVAEAADLTSHGITLRLAGIPRDAVALALTEPCQGRRCTVWEVWLDRATGAVIGDPAVVFRGRMDTMSCRVGETATVEIAAEDRLTDMDSPNLARYTDEDQQRAWPGDRFLAFVSATVDATIIWPGPAPASVGATSFDQLRQG